MSFQNQNWTHVTVSFCKSWQPFPRGLILEFYWIIKACNCKAFYLAFHLIRFFPSWHFLKRELLMFREQELKGIYYKISVLLNFFFTFWYVKWTKRIPRNDIIPYLLIFKKKCKIEKTKFAKIYESEDTWCSKFHLNEETTLRKATNPVKVALSTRPILEFVSYDHHIYVVSTVNTISQRRRFDLFFIIT